MNKPSSTKKTVPPNSAPKKITTVAGSVKAKSQAAAVAPKVARSSVSGKSKVTPTATATTVPVIPSRDTKQSRLITLLNTPFGATIAQIREATGWQAHTVRGTISGVLRKKLGYQVTCTVSPESNARLYRITGSVA